MEEEFYTQQQITRILNISARMLIYWEKQGIISSGVKEGKIKKYPKSELEKIKIITDLLKKGYPPSFLKKLDKEKIFEIENLFWDSKEEKWKTEKEIAEDYLKKKFLEISSQPNPLENLIDYFFEVLDK
jgi:DNA-binding transcriptional MerR regulator